MIGIANGVTREFVYKDAVGELTAHQLSTVVDGKSWNALLRDYDLSTGHLWTLVLAWLALGPCVVRRLQDHVQVPRPAGAR